MTYSPGSQEAFIEHGVRGTITMRDNASIGAWEHELQHAIDDRDAGWKGFESFFGSYESWWSAEKRGYSSELLVARSIEDKRLRKSVESEIRDIMETERVNIWKKLHGYDT